MAAVMLIGLLAAAQAPARANFNNCSVPYPDGVSFAMSPLQSLDALVGGNDVSTENAWTGSSYALLRSRPSLAAVGTWEEYRLWCVDSSNGYYAIQSFSNGNYVSAEIGWTGNSYGLLRARAATVGPWEKFRVLQGHVNAPDWLNYDYNVVAFQSVANGSYVSAELGWTGNQSGLLRARPNQWTEGPWETFYMTWCVISCTG